MDRHLFVLGFMGTGKSTLAPLVAERRKCPFIDLDARIADRAGKSIVDIFRYDGEESFRLQEHEALAGLAEAPPSVVACGGGVITRPDSTALLDGLGDAVVLTADAGLLVERTAREHGRPLLNKHGAPEVSMRVLLDERAPAYAHFAATVDTSLMEAEELAALIDERSAGRAGTVRLPVGDARAEYFVRIGHGILDELGDAVAHVVTGRTAVIVTNPVVGELYADTVSASLSRAGFTVHVAHMPDGEAFKTLDTAGLLYDECLAAGIDRHSVIVALGGGVVGDVAGFVAATVLRGIAVVQVPTTLLAMVDSSIGGKTGVDSPRGKNLIGAFHQPALVWADLATLDTLSDAQLIDGMAEVVKYAMILDLAWPADGWPAATPPAADASLFAYLEAHSAAMLRRDPVVVASVVERCAGHKARVVSVDARESGLRAILNYGHTIGHGLEAAAGYDGLTHGQAVALGMIAAGRISVETGRLTADRAARQEALLVQIGLPTRAPALSKAKVLEAITHDKKAVDGRPRFVLARAIGAVELTDDVPPALVESVVAALGCT